MTKNPIPKKLMDSIVCPVCKSKLKFTPKKDAVQCTYCKVQYPIKNGHPILLPPGMI